MISIVKSLSISTNGGGILSLIASNKSLTPSLLESKDSIAHPSFAAAYIVW